MRPALNLPTKPLDIGAAKVQGLHNNLAVMRSRNISRHHLPAIFASDGSSVDFHTAVESVNSDKVLPDVESDQIPSNIFVELMHGASESDTGASSSSTQRM